MSDLRFKKRVLFVGMPDMAYICLDGLKAAGVNIVGVMGAKKDHPTYFDFKNFVESRNLNFIEYDNLNDGSFITKIRDLNFDIAVVCSFNYKIPKILLEAVKDGFINVHPSLLPHYRGKNPYSSVIAHGASVTGVTLHFMDEGWDTGDIILQEKLQITPKETMGTLFNRLNFMGYEMLLRVLTHYETSQIPRFAQPQVDTIEGKSFCEEELFIDFDTQAVEIERFIRALNPFLNASTFFRNTFVKIYKADVIKPDFTTQSPPGTIIKIEKDKFHIATQKGIICPSVIQFGSFFTGTAKDFIEILNPKIGEKFGA